MPRTPVSRERWALAGILLLPVLLFGRALLPGWVLSPAGMLFDWWPWRGLDHGPAAANPLLSDVAFVFHPWLAYARDNVRAGRLPLWNPHAFCGAPFLGNMQSALFSPFTALAYVLPLPAAIGLAAIAKLEIAGTGMFALLRLYGMTPAACVLGAASFMLSGFLVCWLQHPQSSVAAWLPWAFWLTERFVVARGNRRLGWLAVLTCVQFLGGHPETSFHLVLAAAAYVLWRARSIRLGWRGIAAYAGALVLGTAMAAVQLAPFLDYASESSVLRYRLDPALPYAALPWRYLTASLVPLFGVFPGNFSEANAWVGLAPWVLLPAGLASRDRQVRFFAWMAGFSIVAAFENPVVGPVLARLPGFGQGPGYRLLFLAAFALAVLAGAGFDRVFTSGGGRRRALAWVTLGVTAVLAGAVATVGWEPRSDRIVTAIRLAGNPTRAYAGYAGGAIRAWRVREGTVERMFRFQRDGVTSLDVSPDGRLLAAGGEGGTVVLWDVAAGRPLRVLAGGTGRVSAVRFSPDGRTLAAAGADGTSRLWPLGTAAPPRVLRGHAGEVRAAVFGRRGDWLATGGADGTVRLWETRSGELLQRLPQLGGTVWGIGLSGDGRTLAAAGNRGLVGTWRLPGGTWNGPIARMSGEAWFAAAVPGSDDWVVGGDWGTINRLGADGAVRRRFHLGFRDLWSLDVSADGALLAAGGPGGIALAWDARTGESTGPMRVRRAVPEEGHPGIRLAVAGLVASGLLVVVALLGGRRRLPGFLLAAVQAASLLPLPWTFHALVARRDFYPAPPAVAFLQGRPGSFRVLWPNVNLAGVYGLAEPTGYDAMTPRVIENLAQDRPSLGRFGNDPLEFPSRERSDAVDRAGVRYLVRPPNAPVPAGPYAIAYDGPDGRVVENRNAYPRAFVVASLGDLAAGGRPWVAAARVTADQGERVVVAGRAPRPGHLVLADTFARGWTARARGVQVPVVRAGGAFRAVPVDQGEFEVEFRYRPVSFVLGVLVSLLAAAVAAVLLAAGPLAGRARGASAARRRAPL